MGNLMSLEKFLEKKNISMLLAGIFTLLGALFVRLYGLSDYYYTSDDAWHLVVASQPTILDVIKYNFYQEVHPPLSYIIWHLMLQISHNELWIRSFAIVPGILLIPSIYILGRLYIGKVAAYTMSMTMAFGALPVVISISVRAYSMMMLVLVWAGIFVYKYNETNQRKYLAYYFTLALISILLNHSAAFLILTFGTVLMFFSYKKKAFSDLAIIILGHIGLAAITLGYGYALENYWQGRQLCYFDIIFSIPDFLVRKLFIVIINFSQFISSCPLIIYMGVVLTLFSPAIFIHKRKWLLLYIVFTPVIAVFVTDYLRIYPLSVIHRNNLFLFLSFLIVTGLIAQTIFDYFTRIIGFKNFSFAVIFAPVLLTCLVAKNDFFHNHEPGSLEFSFSKSDLEKVLLNIDNYSGEGNILVTDMKQVWQFLLLDGSNAKITYITENLALYQSDKYHFYFTAFPGIFKDMTFSLYELQQFYVALFNELKNNGKMSSVKNIIYFSFGDFSRSSGIIDKAFFPQFIESKRTDMKSLSPDFVEYYKNLDDYIKEQYDLGWTVHTSDQVTIKAAFTNADAGTRDILFLGMTTKFINDNILQKDFIDIYSRYKEMVFRK